MGTAPGSHKNPSVSAVFCPLAAVIITALSRIRWLFVAARNSRFTYKGQTVDVKQVGRELGVCYVLVGSVRKGGYNGWRMEDVWLDK